MERKGASMETIKEAVKTYFVTIPGQDCETICGLPGSIQGKLDDIGGKKAVRS